MFCPNCGNQVDDRAVVCVRCGCSLNGNGMNNFNNGVDPYDAPSTGMGILGFFIPIVGLILFLMWRPTQPQKAKSAGIGALIGFIVNIVFTIIYIIVFGFMFVGMNL